MKTPPPQQQAWTVLDIISASATHLEGKGIVDARLNAELLLAHTLGCRRIDLYANFDKPLKENERSNYKNLLKRRLAREPLQYILGDTEFFGLKFLVNQHVLIPRPDTELLVEKTIELCRGFEEGTERIHILDIGTGCGNIATSITKSVGNAVVTAIDISREALEVARKNAQAHGIKDRVILEERDIFQDSLEPYEGAFDIVVSNPPYIAKNEFEHLYPEIRDYEPRFATCDEGDGLRFFRHIADVGKKLLRSGGYLFFENGFGQSEDVREIMRLKNYTDLEIFKDLGGIERVIKGRSN